MYIEVRKHSKKYPGKRTTECTFSNDIKDVIMTMAMWCALIVCYFFVSIFMLLSFNRFEEKKHTHTFCV